ncbi:hypothetical protein EC919_102112 [Pseudomonas graminis]|nr:hypothetical protein [Pseudomonas graminis]TDV56744.1 hypothetical protein EC919_102112 [Pseudomonas graminis]
MSVTILGPLSADGEKLRLYAFHVPAERVIRAVVKYSVRDHDKA